MSLEAKLQGWTGPSSTTEQEKQERAERMVRQAVTSHPAFDGYAFRVYAKGSYANNTNVRSDSDVDIAVQCTEATYSREHESGVGPKGGADYEGPWTPAKFRKELAAAMEAKFPGQVDTSGSTAIRIDANSARVDADVVPCFNFRYYFSPSNFRPGAMIIKKDGTRVHNYAEEQLKKGRAKNVVTNMAFKQAVRILKRVENNMVVAGKHREVPSYFIECLVYNVPDDVLKRSTWESTIRGVLNHLWSNLDGDEPEDAARRWHEVSEWKYLFTNQQPWSRKDGRDFTKAAWNYLELGK
ncbi:hypothetical protein ASE01_00865 [Nocardioides sp. Root190]|uniref:nucleotidyltransferase domain-containing protein n=1 Tax=Nocardioides sp. Root190 TaxID=1736488 RepID=UPI000700C417|nr:nucleotidyltransferase [Nocardioides sp. Root190]KRB80090.1 hypothetical protein ASE01_00865 [Nocardioides sp. Root190]